MEKYFNKEFLMQHKKKIIQIGAAVLIIIVAIAIYASGHSNKDEDIDVAGASTDTNAAVQTAEEEPEEVIVDICGAVNDSKVVTLPAGARVEDAIKAAGGTTDEADLSGINRAAILTDGEKIYIPTADEVERGIELPSSENVTTSDGTININEATAEELETLNGIGPVTAEKIIQYRTEYGKFENKEDLMEVNGIGEKTYAQIKDKIRV